jgi:hypothetical protein
MPLRARLGVLAPRPSRLKVEPETEQSAWEYGAPWATQLTSVVIGVRDSGRRAATTVCRRGRLPSTAGHRMYRMLSLGVGVTGFDLDDCLGMVAEEVLAEDLPELIADWGAVLGDLAQLRGQIGESRTPAVNTGEEPGQNYGSDGWGFDSLRAHYATYYLRTSSGVLVRPREAHAIAEPVGEPPSSTSCAATASMAVSASLPTGGSGAHSAPFRSRNISRVDLAARLLPLVGGGSKPAAGQYSGLVGEVRVELFAAQAGRGCVQRRVGQVAAAGLHQHNRVDAGHLFGEQKH